MYFPSQHLEDKRVKHLYSASVSQDLPKRKERKLHLVFTLSMKCCWNIFLVMTLRSLTGKSDTLFWHRLAFFMIQFHFLLVLFFKHPSVLDYFLKNLYKIVRLCLSSMANAEMLCS